MTTFCFALTSFFLIVVANATLFILFLVHETSTLYIQYFAWGLLGGVDVKWSGGLLVVICIDVIVVRVKVSSGFVPLPNGDRQCGH